MTTTNNQSLLKHVYSWPDAMLSSTRAMTYLPPLLVYFWTVLLAIACIGVVVFRSFQYNFFTTIWVNIVVGALVGTVFVLYQLELNS
jgi:hypothetical protein